MKIPRLNHLLPLLLVTALGFLLGWTARDHATPTTQLPSPEKARTRSVAKLQREEVKTPEPAVVPPATQDAASPESESSISTSGPTLEQSLHGLEAMSPGSERLQKLSEILKSHEIKNLADANRLYALLSGHERINFASKIAGNLAKTDIQAALTWAAGLPSGQGRVSSLAATTQVWVDSDPRGALEWSLKNNTTAENSNILGAAFSAWMSKSPDQALALLNTLPRDKNRETLMGQAITSLLDTPGAQGALDLFDSELSVEGQRIASYGIASKLLLSDPAAATAWAEQITDDRARQNAIGRIAADWSASAPDAAAAWAENLPEGSSRAEALANISFQWTKSDPEAAANWLTNFKKGDERDYMVWNFSLNLVEYDPESAVNWAGSITDPAVKHLRIEELTTVWLRKDPAAARTWIANNSPSGGN